MADKINLETNLAPITTNQAPTTANLPKGYLAFGKVGGVNKIYGNPTGNAVEEFGGGEVANSLGDSATKAISQKIVSDELAKKSDTTHSHTGLSTNHATSSWAGKLYINGTLGTGEQTKYLANTLNKSAYFDQNGYLYEGTNTAAGARVYSTQNKPTATDIGALPTTGGTVTDTLIISKKGDGEKLLVLDTERAWFFKQELSGASAKLVLQSVMDGKAFEVQDVNGNMVARFQAGGSNGSSLTATKFIGDGSGLTNLPASSAILAPSVTEDSPAAAEAFKMAHPVGSYYMSSSSRNPASFYQKTSSTAATATGACGTWVRDLEGRSPIGVGTSDQAFAVNAIGGASTHTLSIDETPLHSHKYGTYASLPANVSVGGGITFATPSGATSSTTGTGGGLSHNNLHPYKVVYAWRRTV